MSSKRDLSFHIFCGCFPWNQKFAKLYFLCLFDLASSPEFSLLITRTIFYRPFYVTHAFSFKRHFSNGKLFSNVGCQKLMSCIKQSSRQLWSNSKYSTHFNIYTANDLKQKRLEGYLKWPKIRFPSLAIRKITFMYPDMNHDNSSG